MRKIFPSYNTLLNYIELSRFGSLRSQTSDAVWMQDGYALS